MRRKTIPTRRRDKHTSTKLYRLSLILLVWGLLTGCSNPIPSDELLIERFTANQDSFETLVAMMEEDTDHVTIYTIYQITKNCDRYYARWENESEGQRLQKYCHLLNELDLHSITHTPDKEGDKVRITVLAQGWSPEGGIYKGYEYFPEGLPEKNQDQLVASLEYAPDKYESDTWLYRHIEGNWYLWFLY